MNDTAGRLTRVEESDVDRPATAARLAAAAEAEGILDVAYRTVDTPVGPLLLAATEQGLVRVAYPSEDHDAVLQALADRISPRMLHAPGPPRPRGPAARRVLRRPPAALRRAAGLAAVDRLPLDRAAPPGPDVGYGHTASYAAAGRGWPATRGRSAPSAPPARPTRCRSSCPATGWCAPTARSAATSAGVEAKRTLLDLEAAA